MSERKSRKVRKTESPEEESRVKNQEPGKDKLKIIELQTANSQLPTEPMEVHHHPDLHHKEKPWKEYLLEGLMIFVAVTMGFFAESLREHITNKEREHQVVASLVKDIKKDTAILNSMIDIYMPMHNRWVDSADDYINSLNLKGNEQKITMAFFNATNWVTYTPPVVSLNNLKSSGTFNLIGKEKVKAEILIYNTKINDYIKYGEFLTGVEHEVDTAITSFISRKVQRSMVAKQYINTIKNRFGFIGYEDLPTGIKFRTYNKAVFINYLKRVDEVDNLLNDMLGQNKRIFSEEMNLLKVLKEEYNLDDE